VDPAAFVCNRNYQSASARPAYKYDGDSATINLRQRTVKSLDTYAVLSKGFARIEATSSFQ
jgi:hypothetical protein